MEVKDRWQDKQSIEVDVGKIGKIEIKNSGTIVIGTESDTLKLSFDGGYLSYIHYSIKLKDEISINDTKSTITKEEAEMISEKTDFQPLFFTSLKRILVVFLTSSLRTADSKSLLPFITFIPKRDSIVGLLKFVTS
jgi:hypothetical protein